MPNLWGLWTVKFARLHDWRGGCKLGMVECHSEWKLWLNHESHTRCRFETKLLWICHIRAGFLRKVLHRSTSWRMHLHSKCAHIKRRPSLDCLRSHRRYLHSQQLHWFVHVLCHQKTRTFNSQSMITLANMPVVAFRPSRLSRSEIPGVYKLEMVICESNLL